MKVKSESKAVSHVRLLATPWTAAYQAPLSMGFSRQEYWSGVPLPSPEICLVLTYFSAINENFSLQDHFFFLKEGKKLKRMEEDGN